MKSSRRRGSTELAEVRGLSNWDAGEENARGRKIRGKSYFALLQINNFVAESAATGVNCGKISEIFPRFAKKI
jgi:hypothetical protein